ncbi:LolA family protein [Myceligenerans pegani]|uniref:Outer membrane lipoprotein carrier protein LolA n=1 Tax=Myceligenerans pegani TaxID=2776917 RepID=A0ABR9N387_9MICO|nr:outer membrane lipoprotein carrier protein LolA [Myceligenerans sp. TRM 65318]MBE1878113.1 outer membrane lipoprotein carrier protein LolA [Myceligenerans sp. TRM 65318]MBE3020384.1 outer membrane lipoprotein carrier protein LolA [Myceligenerans sp. TRM 65318]
MRPRTKAWVAAGSGIAVGLTGLALSALPAGADDDPVLPEIGAEELVTSALEARPPAFDGVAEVTNELGLPPVPGAEALDFESVRVFHDGAESTRVQIERPASELTFVTNTEEAWAYDSQEHAARQLTWDEDDAAAARDHAEAELADPSRAAAEIIERLRPTSDIFVDGTASVAGRDAYELVLTPKPSEKTLLREITVAIDEETRAPLRLEVFANGTTDPVLSLGFVEFEVGAQDAELFEFTPPEGAEVESAEADDVAAEAGKHGGRDAGALEERTTTIGDGWDTVVIGEMPAEARSGEAAGPARELGEEAGALGEFGGGDQDLAGMLEQFGTPVSGEFGSGVHVEIAVGGAIVTDDGRIAAGAVPRQVLVDALDGADQQ